MTSSEKKILLPDCFNCPVRHKTAFDEFKDFNCKSIDAIREVKLFKAGQTVEFKNKNENGFFCIQDGHVQFVYEDKLKSGVIRICGPGDMLGFETNDGHVTAVALENAKLCFIERKSFSKLQQTVPEIANGIIRALVRIIAIKNERIIGLENYSIKNRISATLLSLMNKFGVPSDFGTLIDVKIERKTLAKLSGTVVESLARVLTELEEQKVILRDGRKIHVVNKEKLTQFSVG